MRLATITENLANGPLKDEDFLLIYCHQFGLHSMIVGPEEPHIFNIFIFLSAVWLFYNWEMALIVLHTTLSLDSPQSRMRRKGQKEAILA